MNLKRGNAVIDPVISMMYDNHAFSQTLKTGHPGGMFSHKIIRDEVNFPGISSKNWYP